MDDARETAIAKLAELLKHPDDLTAKVGPLKRRLAKEKASIEAQLNTGVQTQLDYVQGGLETLLQSSTDNDTVKSDMRAIETLCVDAQSMISDFALINKISRVHQHFVATQEKLDAFSKLENQLNDIEDMLQPMQEEPLHANEDLLHLHYHLFKLEEFRDQTIHQARFSPHDVKITLKKYFSRVDTLLEDFTQHLWFLARHLLQLIDEGCGPTVVKLVKIIECEERADEKALAVRQAQETHKDMDGHKHWRLTEGNPRTIKSFRVEFFEQLHQSIFERFKQELEPFKEQQDWGGALDCANFVFDDLVLVFDEIVPKFPKKYKIFPYFVLEYHRHTYDLLNLVFEQEQELGSGDILLVLRFVRVYYERMSVDLGVTEELLEPQLLDGQESVLVDKYLASIRGMMETWVSRIRQMQTKDFLEREKEPEKGPDRESNEPKEKYIMTGAVDLFNIINQQIEVASGANQGKLLYLVVSECYRVIMELQKYWKDLLAKELRKQLAGDSDLAPNLVSYIIALANDQYRCVFFTETVAEHVMKVIDAGDKEKVTSKLEDAMDGFENVAHFACDALLDIVLNDVRAILAGLFTGDWYDKRKNSVLTLIETFKDYIEEFDHFLFKSLFDHLMQKILDRLLVEYLKAMRHRSAEFRKEAADNMAKDTKGFYDLFARFLDESYLENELTVLEKVHDLLSSSRDMVFADYYALRQAYPDVPLAFVESLLSKRTDLDRSTLKDIIESIKAKARDNEPDPETPPTIFSRIKW